MRAAGLRRAASRGLSSGRRGEPVLTVRQPWASAIFHAGKDVENRSWSTDYRGRLWIHSGLATGWAGPDAWADAHGLWVPEEPLPRGVILGSVQLVGVVRNADSPWALVDQYPLGPTQADGAPTTGRVERRSRPEIHPCTPG